MNLIKDVWKDEDVEVFRQYLDHFKNVEKEAWARRILQTQLPLLALKTKTMDEIVRAIAKGNYTSFLDLRLEGSYEEIAIYGKLLTYIKDFEELKKYLEVYKELMENWAHCDLLNFHLIKPKDLLSLVDDCLYDKRVFVRRLGLFILFILLKEDGVLDMVFERMLWLEEENAYYVIMMSGWLLSEAIILYEESSLDYLKTHPQLNKKIVNKAIQKCRESRRLSVDKKEMLKAYKR